ncbi:putative linear gramicidin synthase subunit D, partial [Cucurbitaria berberidis CBS 394.84]
VQLSDLQHNPTQGDLLTIVDWQIKNPLSMEVSQPQPDLLFKKDKSYMLVGMTGEMGLSLARWMIKYGAGGVILTSRNPKIKEAWINEMEATGAKIKIGAFNATSRDAWVQFQSEVKNEMPPLAGIINGAVILQDHMFLDMDINVFNDTLAPKIDITINLDEVFKDIPLDFFIVFSSLSFIIGNRGQTNYNAGNAFVTSFVKQRRTRGQAGSVLHLGSVVGVGYLTRAGDVMEQILLKYGYMPVSEVDLQHLVAQAIMVGLPDSGENPEMITGLRYAREDEETGVHWSTNPRFSHMILPPIESNETKASLSTRAQLAAARTIPEAEQAFETSFSAKLMAILQMESSAFRQDAALIELGVDSLVAVEIRSWVLKEVNVDMAVLKILGGASTTDLSQFAIEQMAKELLPSIGNTAQDTPAKAKDADKPTSAKAQRKSFNDRIEPVISSAQSRFWFLNMFLADQTGSNVTLSYNIRGRIRVSDFARAVKATTRAHEALRTCFVADEESKERAWQGVMEESKLELEYKTISSADQVIDLGNLKKNLAYWQREFEQISPVLPLLPVSKVTSRQAISSYGSTYVERRLDPKLSAKMKATCQKFHVTMSHFYLATYRILLARLTGVDDICIGLADANRHDSKVISTVGLFLNSLPLHFTQQKDRSFGDVLRETRAKVYEGLSHAGVPFDELLQALRLSRSSSHSPLFQAFFDYHQGAMEKFKFSNTSWENVDRNPGETAYDITLDVVEGSAGSLVAFMGQDYLYGPAEMQKVLDCYVTLLEQFVEDPAISSEEARIFSQPQIAATLELGQDAAVILFTSGSTGTPKGINLRHRNIINHIEGYVKEWQIGREKVLQQSAFSFDLSMGQIFTALSMGGTLVVAPTATRADPTALAGLIRRENITWTLLTPSEYASILQASPKELTLATSWKHALACGEVLPRATVRAFATLDHPTLQLYNAYGPAEAVISATMAEIPLHNNNDNRPVTIGRPNPNYSIYIVDDNCNLVPQGFPGEILIGGCAIGIGYLNKQELTKEKFITNPFTSQIYKQNLWNSAYRTGDKGRFESDGSIRYEGRRDGDSQVKIRGYRVELQDIESSLLTTANGTLVDAVVTLRADSQTLVAHVIFSLDREPADPTTYLAELNSSLPLPVYMKPAMVFPIDKYPKNLHGKTDRKAIAHLPLPLNAAHMSDDTAELSPLEERLVQTWREVLPSEFAKHLSIGAETEFFAVGGNSLLLVKLQSRIRVDFNVSLGLLQLFEASKLAAMATRIQVSNVIKEIDWDEETALRSENLGQVKEAVALTNGCGEKKLKDGKVVLLTGATGYFGSYILWHLIQSPDVQSIHCVAVRGHDQISAEDRVPLSSNSKVTVYDGDLTSSRFGLAEETWNTLGAFADLIIHSGSRRSFWDNYWALRSANVLSTKELLRLAIPRKVPIHFLSSSGVLKLNDTIDGSAEASVATFEPPIDGSDGYVASKWASEVILENASQETGVPVVVHRFTPRADTSPTEVGDLAMEDLLTSTERLGILPDRSTWEGRFDLVHSPRTAAQICESSVDGALRFVHHQGEASYSPKQLFDLLEGKLGKKVEKKMDMLEWVGAIKRTGYDWLFSTHELVLTTTKHGVTTKLVNVR